MCLLMAAPKGAGTEEIFDIPANGFPARQLSPVFAGPCR